MGSQLQVMDLSPDDQALLGGSRGKTVQRIMQAIVDYGRMFGAKRLVDITHEGHFMMSMGVGLVTPFYTMMDDLIAAGLRCTKPFTMNPRPYDFKNIPSNVFQKLVSRILYKSQGMLERQLANIGLKDANAFSCTPYLPEVGNIPSRDDILAWSESSAVVFVNSVIGARTNRNSGGMDIFMNIVGRTPEFGLLTDEGRKATWLIDLKCSSKPDPHLLGSAIGFQVMEDVPYIKGLDKFLGNTINEENIGYLKDMGAASASNGAVGLYHVEGLTPEANEAGMNILVENYQTYVIDDAELKRIYNNYPNIWKKKNAKPNFCFIGCPHLTLQQLKYWSKRLSAIVKNNNKLKIETILLAAPDVISEFKKDTVSYQSLIKTGAKLSSICPLMYAVNPLSKQHIITNSNKTRTYTSARFFLEDELIEILKTGRLPGSD